MCIQAKMKIRRNNHLNGKKNLWKLCYVILFIFYLKCPWQKYAINRYLNLEAQLRLCYVRCLIRRSHQESHFLDCAVQTSHKITKLAYASFIFI